MDPLLYRLLLLPTPPSLNTLIRSNIARKCRVFGQFFTYLLIFFAFLLSKPLAIGHLIMPSCSELTPALRERIYELHSAV